ncbi:MAG: hypothetical protein M1814_006706 [Vezdaea aestivalis]|nr:MAG: hypothetical protein M1814_006706 [Vezdaea aestivalis]
MPPKKDAGGKKPAAVASKVVADKTFGMKNKKGSSAKKQIAQLHAQASSSKTPDQKRKDAEKAQREAEKKAAEDAKREAAELFKPVQDQKVPFGVDPKTVLCIWFKKGNCEKGKKCKFAHDLAVERKAEKRNLYEDARDEEKETKEDAMENWDEEKLRSVVKSKHGNPQTTTDKVCKFFTSAVEDGKYGWFWQCPNGGDKCMYKHSLPPGFILKTKEQRAAEKAHMDKSPLKTLTLEDFLESERHKLTGTLTPVTAASFAEWKRDRLDKKAAEDEARKAKEATGRALFEKGEWDISEDESEEEDTESDDAWNLNSLRQETEAAAEQKEVERVGGHLTNGNETKPIGDDG